VVGVVENMSYLPCPHCGPEHRIDLFGAGGGQRVAETLSARFGYDVPLLAEVPLDPRLRSGGDSGQPLVWSEPDAPASVALGGAARRLSSRGRNLAGMQLGLTPTSKL
jgi:ATP-binding protein involved in chromosome partitioning